MSGFGRPPGQRYSKPVPPERGSFPLDHDGECKPVMKDYLSCLRKVRGANDPECRLLAKAYLQCRMDNNLMLKDDFSNLGFVAASTVAKEVAKEETDEKVNEKS